MTRPPATTAGFRITVRGRRVYLVDVEPTSDPGMSHHEATELAQRLLHAAAAAERCQRKDRKRGARPDDEQDPYHDPGEEWDLTD
jgi:hypothetical protein